MLRKCNLTVGKYHKFGITSGVAVHFQRGGPAAPGYRGAVIPERVQPLLDDVEPLAQRFADAGHDLYLVGGVVRDLIVGRERKGTGDIDLTTSATPDQIKAVLQGWADALWTQGERFGTIGARHGGVDFEITTHRAEAYDPASRNPEVAFSTDIHADLSRRDFTVNAMALSLPEPELIDPFGGVNDLHDGILRTPGSPADSFTDDPLRMMRAARFIAGYGLRPTPELIGAVTDLRGRLEIVAPERVRDELDKLMVVDDPTAGLWFLVETGLAREFLPELPMMSLEQDPIHRHKDVLAHTIAVVANTSPNRIVRLAALFHDIGKPDTRRIDGGKVSFHHHEVVGARMTRERMKAMRYSNDDVAAVSKLVYLHLRFHTYAMGWTDSAVRRFVRDAGDLLDELIELTRCDCTTRNAKKARTLARRMDDLEERIARLQESDDLKAMRPELNGQEVMELLDLQPGREIGEALDFLLEIRLDEGLIGKEACTERLVAWHAERK